MSFFSELKRRNVFRVGAAYVVTAWLLIQVAETIFPLFGFDEAPARVIVIVFAIGFIPTLAFSWVYELTAEGLKKEKEIDRSQSITDITGRKLDFTIIGLLIVALGYFAYDRFMLDPGRVALAMRNAVVGLEEVRYLVGEDRNADAYFRAKELDPELMDESLREELWDTASRAADFNSEPIGASVWVRPYDSSERHWEFLGQTPLKDVRVPLGMTRLRLELEGYRTLRVAAWQWDEVTTYSLDPVDALSETMVRVQGADFEIFMPGLEHLSMALPDFLIDTFEVTNKQFKTFVDAGGYAKPEYWENQFMQEGRELSFEQAMGLFRDKTGRSGPGTWELGMYPDGNSDHPVAGVSWYEAAAYAKFVNKQLPTIYHWYWAAYPHASQFMLPRSNFTDNGTVPVGTFDGISRSGAFDMAGNVREWTWNRHDNNRFVLGGGWSDPEYMFTDANAQSPFDRSDINGLRLMISIEDTSLQKAHEPIIRLTRDYWSEHPVSDEIFEVYQRLYAYDKTALNAELVARDGVAHWAREKIEIDAAYGNERLTVYLFLPEDAKPPYRPMVYFPGSSAIYRNEFPPEGESVFHFLLRSGYAILFPVYKGTYERGTDLGSDVQNETNSYRNHVIQWSKDLGRSLDYLEERTDMKMRQLGYFSLSWGSAMAPVMIAMEPRIKAGVLISGGLVLQPTQPEVDPFNFLPRVLIPTRMVNIPNDYFYALESSQKPFYQYLGSEMKDHVLLEGGHRPPMNHVARETLDWFEQHLNIAP